MGYLVTAHIIKGQADRALFNDLPAGVSFNAFKVDNFDAQFLSCYKAGSASQYPFQAAYTPPALSEWMDTPNHFLNPLYEVLRKAGAANTFRRGFVNLNLIFSKTLNLPVLSFVSDDDETDFAIQSTSGVLEKLHFRADDIEVVFQEGQIHIYPLQSVEDEPIFDLSLFNSTPYVVHPREREYSSLIHNFASAEVKTFLQTEESVLGLNTFDGPTNSIEEIFKYEGAQETPQAIQETKATHEQSALSDASRTSRLIAVVIDIAIIPVLYGLIEATLKPSNSLFRDLLLFLNVILFFTYLPFKDAIFGQSIGKRLLGLQVVQKKTGKPCTPWQSFFRNIIGFIGIFDWACILTSGRQRIGDIVVGTRVVKLKKVARTKPQ